MPLQDNDSERSNSLNNSFAYDAFEYAFKYCNKQTKTNIPIDKKYKGLILYTTQKFPGETKTSLILTNSVHYRHFKPIQN